MMIVRAARDMPANTEITFQYVDCTERAKLNTKLSSGWGFECTCAICTDDRDTTPGVKIQRRKLIASFHLPGTSTKKREDIINKINKTYSLPSTQVPRLAIWDLFLILVNDIAVQGETDQAVHRGRVEMTLKYVLGVFESIGFVMEGTGLDSNIIVVKRWGYPHNGVASAWLALRNIYQLQGRLALAEQAK
jgi:hypothetical protein